MSPSSEIITAMAFEDYIVASPLVDFVAVIVMKKNTAYSEVSVASVSSGQYFRVIKGPSGSTCGSSLGGIGDINGDSYDDVIIGCATGAVSGRGNAGYAVVIFGKTGPFSDVTVTSSWNDPTTGFKIVGIYANARFAIGARSTRGLGDFNGDGIDDFAVSSSSYGTYEKTALGWCPSSSERQARILLSTLVLTISEAMASILPENLNTAILD